MRYVVEIPGNLPGLNDFLGSSLNNRYKYGSLKKKWTQTCAEYIIAAGIPKFNKPLNLKFTWIEKHARRDLDNIAAGKKFFIDGLVLSNRIPYDTRAFIQSFSDMFPPPNPKNPRVIVEIEDGLRASQE